MRQLQEMEKAVIFLAILMGIFFLSILGGLIVHHEGRIDKMYGWWHEQGQGHSWKWSLNAWLDAFESSDRQSKERRSG